MKSTHLEYCMRKLPETYFCRTCFFGTKLKVTLAQHILNFHQGFTNKVVNEKFIFKTKTCQTCSFETVSPLHWFRHKLLVCPRKKKVRKRRKKSDEDEEVITILILPPEPETEKTDPKSTNSQHKVYKKVEVEGQVTYVPVEGEPENTKRLKKPYNRKFLCDKCGIIVNYSSRNEHINISHTSSYNAHWYLCDQCYFKTKLKQNLQKHIISKHTAPQDQTWYKCDECDFKTVMKHCLARHKHRMHTAPEEIKWFECDYCPFKSKTKFTVKSHQHLVHLDDELIRWFECKICDYKAKRKTTLKVHVRAKHTPPEEIKWHQCQQCDFRTKTKSTLVMHEKRHNKILN